jgi:hypothetical protein
MFAPRERGRFGDNEASDERRDSRRVSGASNLTDLRVWLMLDNPDKKAIAVCDPAKPGKAPWVWLPRSQIEYVQVEPGLVEVTLPEWLAKDKGLL